MSNRYSSICLETVDARLHIYREAGFSDHEVDNSPAYEVVQSIYEVETELAALQVKLGDLLNSFEQLKEEATITVGDQIVMVEHMGGHQWVVRQGHNWIKGQYFDSLKALRAAMQSCASGQKPQYKDDD